MKAFWNNLLWTFWCLETKQHGENLYFIWNNIDSNLQTNNPKWLDNSSDSTLTRINFRWLWLEVVVTRLDKYDSAHYGPSRRWKWCARCLSTFFNVVCCWYHQYPSLRRSVAQSSKATMGCGRQRWSGSAFLLSDPIVAWWFATYNVEFVAAIAIVEST